MVVVLVVMVTVWLKSVEFSLSEKSHNMAYRKHSPEPDLTSYKKRYGFIDYWKNPMYPLELDHEFIDRDQHWRPGASGRLYDWIMRGTSHGLFPQEQTDAIQKIGRGKTQAKEVLKWAVKTMLANAGT